MKTFKQTQNEIEKEIKELKENNGKMQFDDDGTDLGCSSNLIRIGEMEAKLSQLKKDKEIAREMMMEMIKDNIVEKSNVDYVNRDVIEQKIKEAFG